MGVFWAGYGNLESGDDDVAHVGLPDFWTETVGTSFGECVDSRVEHGGIVSFIAENDGGVMAQFDRGGIFRVASVACGIGGVDRGAKGRVEHGVLAADDLGLCAICEK